MLAVKISGQWHKWKVDKGHWRGEESWERETAKVWKSFDHIVIVLQKLKCHWWTKTIWWANQDLLRHDDIALAIGMFCIIAMTCTVVVVKVIQLI